jgi:hypothetical protein
MKARASNPRLVALMWTLTTSRRMPQPVCRTTSAMKASSVQVLAGNAKGQVIVSSASGTPTMSRACRMLPTTVSSPSSVSHMGDRWFRSRPPARVRAK